MTRASTLLALALAVAFGAAAAGCRQDMNDQPRFKPFAAAGFWRDGRSQRPRVPGTIARDETVDDDFLTTGQVGGKFVDAFPFAVTRDVLVRGRLEHDIQCAPCHARDGEGDGVIVQRGLRRPESYHTQRLRAAPSGYLFDVMTRGYGAMLDVADRVTPEDRWAIVAYVRALQRSQTATLADVPPAEREKLARAR